MKLQLYIQQINASLEETNQDVLVNMPKILRDTQLLQQEAVFLKEKMQTVKAELEDVEKGAFSSIHKLEELDRMKEELISRDASLKEADNWVALANDVEDVFESGDVVNVAVKLFEMQKSLTKLANAPDHEDKKLQLEGLKNRLEAAASPKLVQAFTVGSLDQSKIYVDIFTKIDRLPQLLKYFHNCLKITLTQEWRKTIEFAQDENITYWLKMYLDKLLSSWHDQVKWCSQVFPANTVLVTLVELYADLLLSLEPSLPHCVESALKQQSNAIKLSILLELKQTSRQFAANLQSAMDARAERITNDDSDKLSALARAIYAAYVPYVAKYGIYEAAHLNQQLNSLGFNHEDLSDIISTLSLSVPKAMGYADEANERCKLFTEGCGYPGLVKALNTFFNNYQEKFKIGMKQLNKRKVKHEDWNLFQMCLTLMQTTGEFLGHVEQLEKTLLNDISDTYAKLQDPQASVFNRYVNLLLSESAQTEFHDFVASVKKDEKTLLDPTVKTVQKLCSDLHRSTYEVIFAPIFTQLLQIRKAPAWSSSEAKKMPPISSDLPDYSFAPQEYITQVGQYLMTLPQHLEPFLLRDNPSLTKALKAADPQYSQESCESGFTNVLLEIVAKETCQMFQDQTWSIYELNTAACKQLATDIDYLGNIFEELGLSLSENMQQMSQLLWLSPDDYQAGSSGCNPRVVAAVRQMRNITSSG
ncbi:conserved oligomeric Golgi complex subunit 7 isoform X2 [Copidosoma floridanum]|nr:conserved oligomeric Golgi complex subunit 7 isoform X2 [Copidosoma floridanum]XP_014209346.1 conserved oligomeric Golgi complex subunit 7 isoform X2 [Copidosoma floridanum]